MSEIVLVREFTVVEILTSDYEDFKIEYTHRCRPRRRQPQTGQQETVARRENYYFWLPLLGGGSRQLWQVKQWVAYCSDHRHVPPVYQEYRSAGLRRVWNFTGK